MNIPDLLALQSGDKKSILTDTAPDTVIDTTPQDELESTEPTTGENFQPS